MNHHKVLILGLDGVSWNILLPLIEKGKLPTFKRLMKNGVWGDLESTIPPWTIPAWVSLSTGKNPGKLGFASFFVKQGYSLKPYFMVFSRQVKLWDILSESGKEVLLVNLPDIHIAYRIRGCMIAGFLYSNERQICFPSELIGELNNVIGGYKIDIVDIGEDKKNILHLPMNKQYLANNIEELLEKNFAAFKYVLSSKNWDFAFLVTTATDRANHKYLGKVDLSCFYEKVDYEIGELLNFINCDETTVFIVSDHGFGLCNHRFNLNHYLVMKNFLQIKVRGRSIIIANLANFLRRMGMYDFLKFLINLFLKAGKDKGGEEKLRHLIKIDFQNFQEMVNWFNTKAFACDECGGIYVNLKGREPFGVVNPSDYDKLRSSIIGELSKLRYKGRKLEVRVFKCEEVYNNIQTSGCLPDLIILPTDNGIQAINPWIRLDFKNQLFFSMYGGHHRLYGIFLAFGNEIKNSGERLKGVKIYDIAPTVLHIFGLPIPKSMDGRVLKEIFKLGSEPYNKEVSIINYEKERLKRKMQNLKLRIKS